MSLTQELDAKFKALVQKRAGYRSRITAALRSLESLRVEDITEEVFGGRRDDILHYLGKVDEVNDLVIDLFAEARLAEDHENRVKEMEGQVAYRVTVTDKLAPYITAFRRPNVDPPSKPVCDSKSVIKMPELKCKTFSGKSLDKLEFKNFLQQFQNCIDACDSLTDAGKLTYLRSFLTDYAFKTISHLSITDANYCIALQLLKDEFLDIQYIIDEIFKQLLDKQPKFDVSFREARMYINDCRALLYELKTYGVNLLESISGGCRLVKAQIHCQS